MCAIVCDLEGNILSESTLPKVIRPGESTEIYTYFSPSEIEQGKEIKVTITSSDHEDMNTDDNTLDAVLSWNDISVEDIQWGSKDGGKVCIHANIVNRGYDKQTNVQVTLRSDSADGEVVESKTIAECE